VGADTGLDVFAVHGVSRAALESLCQHGYRQCRRVGDEQVQVVGFAVEFHQLDIELGAHRANGGLAEGQYLAGEKRAAVRGCEHKMRVVQRHAVSGASVGRACQWASLRWWRADG
jgi:hypothetical protein